MSEPAPPLLGGLPARAAGWALDTARWKYLTWLAVVMFVKTGMIAVAPALLAIVQSPYENPFGSPHDHYLFWSWLGPFLAHLLGADRPWSFTLFYLACSLGFTALMVRWLFTTLDDRAARVALLVFALLPVSATSYYWIFTDSLTLLLLACTLYLPRYPVAVAALGVLLGMQHAEQAFLGALGALIGLAWARRRGYRGRYHWRWALGLLIGVVVGKVVLVLLFQHWDIHINSGRWYWLRKTWRLVLIQFAYSWQVALFSAFAVGWLVVVAFVRRRAAEALPVAVVLVAMLGLMPISQDPTRVFAIVSFPLIAVLVLANPAFLASLSRETVGLCVLLWLVVPWTFVWAGTPQVSAAAYDVMTGAHELLDTYGPRDPRFAF